MPEALNLPAAMVQAAAEELFCWLKDDEWPADSTRERAVDCARGALTAALAVCEVQEKTGYLCDCPPGYRHVNDLHANVRNGRRLIITTPAEEVPDAP